jgi:hypothetical protein
MKETRLTDQRLPPELRSFLACLATILELPIEQMPQLPRDADPENSWPCLAGSADAASGWCL